MKSKILYSRLPHDLYIKYFRYISTSSETSSKLITDCLIEFTGYSGTIKLNECERRCSLVQNKDRKVKVRITEEFHDFISAKYSDFGKLISDSLRIKFPLKTKKLLV